MKLKSIAVVLAVLAVTGCSSMGAGHYGSGTSAMSTAQPDVGEPGGIADNSSPSREGGE